MPDKQPRPTKAVTRGHDLDGLGPYLEYARRTAETAAFVAVNNDIHDRYALQAALYGRLRDPRVKAGITQKCINQGAAAAKNIHDPERSPTITNPVLGLDNQKWKLNPVGEAYVAKADIGSREHPHIVAIPVSKKVGDMVLDHRRGELWIGKGTFTITYSKEVTQPDRPIHERTHNIAELTNSIDYVGGEPKPMVAADTNAWGGMVGDGDIMAKLDVSDRVEAVIKAKTENPRGDEYRRQMDALRYEYRKGRKISNKNVEEKRRRRVVVLGGERKIHKDGRDIARLKKEMKKELRVLTNELRAAVKGVGDAERKAIKQEFAARRKAVKAKYKAEISKLKAMRTRRKRALNPQPSVDVKAKQRNVTKAVRSLDHALHAAAIVIVMMAASRGAVIVLEDLTGMADGWIKGGRFGRPLRRKLGSAAMLKFQRYVREKAAWAGVEVVDVSPRNTSALCCVCRGKLSGDYTERICRDCTICVDRDVNAVLNLLTLAAAAMYGRVVRPGRDEAQRAPDVILGPVALVRGGRSLRVDREVGLA